MGALNPLFLLAAAAVGVPLFLHLFQRHETRRLSFPALRYLERTEREHAKRIRFRQLLLLLIRLMVVLFLVGAGARLFVQGRGSAHRPTAVVIVLDNSMSSGLVVGERRVLDLLRERALETVDAAGSEDRFWVLRPGEPWLPAAPGTAAEARAVVETTEVRVGHGDLSEALARAAELLTASGMEHREIHLLSDLQAAAFDPLRPRPAGDVDVVVWAPERGDAPNRALTGLLIGGGLAPLAGQRAEVTVTALDAPGDTTASPVRLVVGERIRGAAALPPGAATSVALPPVGAGWVRGYAESDPDALRADDRRYFAFRARSPTAVATAGDVGLFVEQGLAVLDSAGRVDPLPPRLAELVLAGSGEGLSERGPRGGALVVPHEDPARLPALNRRLADAAIPWRYDVVAERGQAELEGAGLPAPLRGVRVRARYGLTLNGDPPGPTRTVAEVAGEAWAVEGTDGSGRPYLLIASPLDAASTTLPLSTAMPGFLDWLTGEWADAGAAQPDFTAGEPLPAPRGATHVRTPSGERHPVDGTRTFVATGDAGFYDFLQGDTAIAVYAVNPPASESDLRALSEAELEAAIGVGARRVDAPGRWSATIYRARQGPEIWWALVLATALLLVGESLLAASGQRGSERPAGTPRAPARAT